MNTSTSMCSSRHAAVMASRLVKASRQTLAATMLVLGLLAGAASSASAQALNPGERGAAVQRKQAAQAEAYDAFKVGDATTALAKLAEGVRTGPRSRNVDLQVAEQLATISVRLSNEGDAARARDVAALSLAKAAGVRGRVTPKESAAALALAAQVHDHVLRDPKGARAAYEEALLYDPTLILVRERLDYLKAAEARAAEKTAANELLRQRAMEDKR